jgi:hypothetical protein
MLSWTVVWAAKLAFDDHADDGSTYVFIC